MKKLILVMTLFLTMSLVAKKVTLIEEEDNMGDRQSKFYSLGLVYMLEEKTVCLRIRIG